MLGDVESFEVSANEIDVLDSYYSVPLVDPRPTWPELVEMMKTKEFLLLYLMNFLSVFVGLFIANEYKVYWLNSGFAPGEKFLATVGAIGSVCNGMRFVWAALLDKFSYRSVYAVLLSM